VKHAADTLSPIEQSLVKVLVSAIVRELQKNETAEPGWKLTGGNVETNSGDGNQHTTGRGDHGG
jgi:hypothetical protein